MYRLRHLKDAHAGKTCVIIGNGPSLTDIPWATLDKFVTFGSNMLIRDYVPTYLACVDPDMVHTFVQFLTDNEDRKAGPQLIFIRKDIPLPGAVPLNIQIKADFSFDPMKEVIIGGTVTYVHLQLAYYMGFQTALLVGMDHNYPGAGSSGKPGSKFIQQGVDLDHYSSDYFEHGKIYRRPELAAVAEYTYPLAKRVWELDGRRIINCSTQTKLEVFPRGKIGDYIT